MQSIEQIKHSAILALLLLLGHYHGSTALANPLQPYTIDQNTPRDLDRDFKILDERAFYSRTQSRWPNNEIVYCLDPGTVTGNDGDLLESGLQTAWESWENEIKAAFPGYENSNVQKLGVRKGTDEECAGAPNTKTLFIKLEAEGSRGSCALGYGQTTGQAPVLSYPAYPSNPNGASSRPGVTNEQWWDTGLAHELGHVWGFFHEHQRPDVWVNSDNQVGTLPESQRQFNFNCFGIPEIQAAFAAQRSSGTSQADALTFVRDVCRNSAQYSTQPGHNIPGLAAWLPINTAFAPAYDQDNVIDLSSIMLYDSTVFKIGNNYAFSDLQNNPFPYNTKPSVRDVTALLQIQGIDPGQLGGSSRKRQDASLGKRDGADKADNTVTEAASAPATIANSYSSELISATANTATPTTSASVSHTSKSQTKPTTSSPTKTKNTKPTTTVITSCKTTVTETPSPIVCVGVGPCPVGSMEVTKTFCATVTTTIT